MLLTCKDICKSYGEEVILDHVSFGIEEREKVAIIGNNGAGKSTLFKIIMDEISHNEGEVQKAKNVTIGYLSQKIQYDVGSTIYDEVYGARQDILDLAEEIEKLEKLMVQLDEQEVLDVLVNYHEKLEAYNLMGGSSYKSMVSGVLTGLGFSAQEWEKEVSCLSGGEKTRVFLAKLLVMSPDLILLDEPTNHLDIGSITWLEGFLKTYKGAVLIISHDRYFLDHVITKVIEIENHKTLIFNGTYTDFAQKKKQLREAQLKKYIEQQKTIKHHEQVVEKLKSFNREASIKRAESREKLIDKIERVDKPLSDDETMHLRLSASAISGKDVLNIENLRMSFDKQPLFHNVDINLYRGEHAVIIGDNGTGKTTILKMINRLFLPDEGTIKIGAGVNIGYYDQEYQVLNSNKTLFDEISDDHPEMTNTEVRTLLGSFMFTEEDAFKQVKDLSGGEKGRLSLAKLMLSEANLLILDEPTNHLDVMSKQILEDAINGYDGTVLCVSHDRYFINKTAQYVLELTESGITKYLGNYDYYLEKKASRENTVHSNSHKVNSSDTAIEWKIQKEEEAKKRKLERSIQQVEEEIAEKEEQLKQLEVDIVRPEYATNSAKLNEIHEQSQNVEQQLEKLYEKWESLSQ